MNLGATECVLIAIGLAVCTLPLVAGIFLFIWARRRSRPPARPAASPGEVPAGAGAAPAPVPVTPPQPSPPPQPPDGSSGRPWPPPTPTALKVVGIIGIVLGAINTVLNIVLPVTALPKLVGNAGAEPLVAVVVISGGACLLAALLQLIGGIGLVRGRLWGRNVSIAAAILSVLAAFGGIVAGRVITTLIEIRGGVEQGFEVYSFGVCGLVPFALALVIALCTESVRRWAAELRAGPGASAEQLEAAPRVNSLAVASLLLSFLPIGPLVLAALVVGIMALRQIARSGGKERGRGLAIAGVVISSLWLLLVLGLVVLLVVLIATGQLK